MGSPEVLPNHFQSLPARPPTPPREVRQHELEAQVKQLLAGPALNARLSLQTPPSLYSPDSAQTDSSTRRAGKKVGFSNTTDYQDAPAYEDRHGKPPQPTPPSLPSSSSRPTKSILKVTAHTAQPPTVLSSVEGSDYSSPNIAEMLESTILQLSGPDRGSRIDAYTMLARALKASNNLPDRVALQERMGTFMLFLQRDLVAKMESGEPDSSMVKHAMTLLITFLQYPAIASSLSADFAVFVLDHCIRSFVDNATPKDVTRHLMQVVVRQNFSSKVMNTERAGKLIKSLHAIEVQGKSIVVARIMIYGKLLKQCRQHMLAHTDWLVDLFTDLLSSIPDIRDKAIELGFAAASSLAADGRLSRPVKEIFDRTVDEQTYFDYYIKMLNKKTADKETSASVPRVWSVVVLLLRHPVRNMPQFNEWLAIMQKCFNNADQATKVEAYHAWNRMVYAFRSQNNGISFSMHTLVQPISHKLKAKGPAHLPEELRAAILGATCNLLYYGFKPNTRPALLDKYWKEAVLQIMPILVGQTASNVQPCTDQGLATLTSLFDSTTPRVWMESRTLDKNMIRPDELPSIDPKWLRRNASKVFALIAPVVKSQILNLGTKDSRIQGLWRALVASVASAAAKEVKVSTDTATFVAEALTLLSDLWSNQLQVLLAERHDCFPAFLLGVEEYVGIMSRALGLLPFTEKIITTKDNIAFRPVATGSRSGAADCRPSSALQSAFLMLSTLPAGGSDDDNFTGFFSRTFSPLIGGKNPASRASIARDLLATLPSDAMLPYGTWCMVADLTCTMLQTESASQASPIPSDEHNLGQQYRDVVKLLERGLRSTPALPWKQWQKLYRALSTAAKRDAGDAGLALGVAEPMARFLMSALPSASGSQLSDSTLLSTAEILKSLTAPKDERAVDGARRRLWGTSTGGFRGDACEQTHALINSVMSLMYTQFPSTVIIANSPVLLEALAQYLSRSPKEVAAKSVFALQGSLAEWVRDPQERVNRHREPTLTKEVDGLFDRICSILAGPVLLQEGALEHLEILLCAGFESTRRRTVNSTCTLWNETFKETENVRYPDRLREVLITLAPQADLVLPSLELATSTADPMTDRLGEDDSQSDLQRLGLPLPRPIGQRQSKTGSSSRLQSSSPAVSGFLDSSGKRAPAAVKSRAKPTTRSTPIRLRHDNSQIAFAPIASSPSHLDILESQILTDRQKEVRDRQKDNAAIFPEIRSSPQNKHGGGTSLGLEEQTTEDADDLPSLTRGSLRKKTPELERTSYDDFVTSTPTPRRGQPVAFPDHDGEAADPPSSPPEPRRGPLFADIQSQSSANSLLDEWQLSSSPISKSPNPRRQAALPSDEPDAPQQMDVDIHVDEALPSHEAVGSDVSAAQAELPATEGIPNGQSAPSKLVMAEEPTDLLPSADALSSTPSRGDMPAQDTPKSDTDEFVDALTSPLPKTPSRIRNAGKRTIASTASVNPRSTAGKSFVVSDIDENDLLQLVVELEPTSSQSREEFQAVSDSPEKAQLQTTQDCIIVNTGKRPRGRPVGSKTRSLAASQETDEAVSGRQSSQAGKKRKRHASLAEETSERKLRRSSSITEADEEIVPSSKHSVVEQRAHDRLARSRRRASQQSSQEAVNEEGQLDGKDYTRAIENTPTPAAVKSGADLQLADDADRDALEERELQEQVSQQLSGGEAGPASASVQLDTGAEILKTVTAGLDLLRGAALDRADVSKIEDVFMEMKRQLYEAELRGRKGAVLDQNRMEVSER